MKVLILGGTGATGRHLCEKAAAAGHAVTALVRDSAAAKLSFPGVTIRQGQPTSEAEVTAAVAGNDAVLSALGPRHGSDPVCVGAAQAVIAAMKKQGVKRLIWISAGGVGDSAPQIIRASFVFGRIIMPLFLRKPYANHARAESSSASAASISRSFGRCSSSTARRIGRRWPYPSAPRRLGASRSRGARWPPSWLRSWPRGSSSARCPCCTGNSHALTPGEFEAMDLKSSNA